MPPLAPYFSAPLHQRGHQYTVLTSGLKRRRTSASAVHRELGDDADDEAGDETGDEGIALDQNEDLDLTPSPPGSPFPHKEIKSSLSSVPIHQQITAELAQLKPPLYLPNGTYADSGKQETPGLKRQHLGVLTAILHRCLLNGDYLRAMTAWSLLVRSGFGGGVNIRQEARWGIGIELLLRSGEPRTSLSTDMPDFWGRQLSVDSILDEGVLFNPANWPKVKANFLRLVTTYTHHASSRTYLEDAKTMYPAYFSTWIYYSLSLRHVSQRIKEGHLILQELDQLQNQAYYDSDISLWKFRLGVINWLIDLQAGRNVEENVHDNDDESASDDATDSQFEFISPSDNFEMNDKRKYAERRITRLEQIALERAAN
jgi:hypothetical protein